MTQHEVSDLRQRVNEINLKVDTLSKSVEDYHIRVEEKNKKQDEDMARLKEQADVIYGAVAWLGTTGRIIKYTAGLLVAIATIVALLKGALVAFIKDIIL